MKWNRRRDTLSLLELLLLALFFFVGVVLGQVVAARMPVSAGDELERYLHHFVALEEPVSLRAVLPAVVLYFRYPLLAFFLGFASVGLVLLPCVAVAFGFFLSFSVSCFVAVFGKDGIPVALAVSGIRCAVTLPCFFALAVPSWKASAALAHFASGKGRRSAPVIYGRVCWLRLVVCVGILLAGLCLDLFVSPWFLKVALERVLT